MAILQRRFTLVRVLVVALLLLACSHTQARAFDDQYDELFKKYTLRYLYGLVPDNDWQWLKALCYQESRLRPDAVSPAGAVGLCQIMPDSGRDFGLTPSERSDPEKNIKAAAQILRRNIRIWWERTTRFLRLQLGLGGYNAGAGNIIKAQQHDHCAGQMLWEFIVPCLGWITGPENAAETRHYVYVIPQWYAELIAVGEGA